MKCKQTVDLQLLKELSESGLTEHQIWSSWHGDSHLIANDQVNRLVFSMTYSIYNISSVAKCG
jgi:hypothetical protein